MSAIKVIFLDIDGVLNNTLSFSRLCKMDAEAVHMLDVICEKTGAKVVLSSTWRKFWFKETKFMLERLGLIHGKVIGATNTLSSGHRGAEISMWLNLHQVSSFVILDDDNDMMDDQLPFFIQTNINTGLTWPGVDKAIKILGRIQE